MTDFFENGNRIRFFFRMLADFKQYIEQLIYIGEVKVSCYDEVSCDPVILTQKRVTAFDTISTKRSVAQMTQE